MEIFEHRDFCNIKEALDSLRESVLSFSFSFNFKDFSSAIINFTIIFLAVWGLNWISCISKQMLFHELFQFIKFGKND